MSEAPAAEPTTAGVLDPARPTGRAWWGGLLLAAVLLAVLLVGVVHYVGRSHDRDRLDTQRTAALAAARSEAVALFTVDYRQADADIGRIIDGSTGELRQTFAGKRAQAVAQIKGAKSVSKGEVLSSALGSLSGDHAQALIAVDATVSSTNTSGGEQNHFRLLLSLQRINGKWLVSQSSVTGFPQ